MKIKAAFTLGLSYLFALRKGKKSIRNMIGPVIGIALSLVPLIVVLEVTNGMIEGITKRYLEIGSFHIQAKTYQEADFKDFENAAEKLSNIPEIKNAIPYIQGMALCISRQDRSGVYLRGYPEDIFEIDSEFKKYIELVDGSFDLSSPNAALLSKGLAKKLGVKPGDKLKLLTTKNEINKAIMLKPSFIVVKGIFSTGYYELDSFSVYISSKKANRLFKDRGSKVIGIKTSDPYSDLYPIIEKVREVLVGGWQIGNWFDLEKPMYKSFQTTKLLLIFIMVLIVFVASVNISSALVMLVIEKRPEIAILKSTGIDPGTLSMSYIFAGLIIGFLGSIIGSVIGVVLSLNVNEIILGIEQVINFFIDFYYSFFNGAISSVHHIELLSSSYYLEDIPININYMEILAIILLTIFMSVISAYFPARNAAKIKPLEIIRKH